MSNKKKTKAKNQSKDSSKINISSAESESKKNKKQVSSDDIAISVKNVKKHFKVYPDKSKTLKDKILFAKRNRYELREVLKGISFDIKKGEAVGLIGKNGCGKSTTLKMLTKILRPNDGTIEMKGRVSSLIELGAGFHPDLTGRENIYINASIFGIKSREVDDRISEIIRFSELEEYIDNPVRTYSSGMYMRLAFAVAINVDADILLIDEILAVGDINFQEKCFAKLKEIKRNGTTIVIVSHAQGQIEKICDRVIWIDEGEIRDDGDPKIVCREYSLVMEGKRIERARIEAKEELEMLKRQEEEAERERLEQIEREKREAKERKEREAREARERKEREERERKELKKKEARERREQREREERERREQREREERERKEREEQERREREEKRIAREKKLKNLTCREICVQCDPDAHREGTGDVEFKEVVVNDGQSPLIVHLDEKVNVKIKIKSVVPNKKIKISIGITRNDYTYCFGTSTQKAINKFFEIDGEKTIEFSFTNILLQGSYFLDFIIEDEEGTRYDGLYEVIKFRVDNPDYKEVGIAQMDYDWKID